ncbi:MAG: VWA domain-containing protein [Labilithrix sp.]|nr:VWA domain-containing protein [Labilithrix sp.]
MAVVLLAAGSLAMAAIAACGSSGEAAGGDDPDGSAGSSGSSGTSGASGGDFGTSSGTSGASSGSSGLDPDAACATTTVAAKRAPANLLFIVDRSGSMNCNPPPLTTSAACEVNPVAADAGAPTKWSITREALKSAIAVMPNNNSVGITYFNNDDECGVQATPNVPVTALSAGQVTLVNGSLDAVTPKGFTPIVGGVTLGYQHLHASTTIMGTKFIVLITDGEETCAPDQQENFVNTTVTNAAAVGIRTFVIGAPGSENNRAILSRVAFNGKTARTPTCVHAAAPTNVGDCHFDLTNAGTNLAAQLNTALDTISKQALSCDIEVPAPDGGTLDYDAVNVIYTPSGGAAQTIPQDGTKPCSAVNGWQYSPDKKQIHLCGAICDTVKADTTGTVQVALGCATKTVPK